MKIAILGGGVAAFEAANSARKVSADAEITIYSAESMLPYRRPALSGMLADLILKSGKKFEVFCDYS